MHFGVNLPEHYYDFSNKSIKIKENRLFLARFRGRDLTADERGLNVSGILINQCAESNRRNTSQRAARRGTGTPVFRARRSGSRNILSNSNGRPRSKSINVDAL